MKEYKTEESENYWLKARLEDGWKVVCVTPVKHEHVSYVYLLEREKDETPTKE